MNFEKYERLKRKKYIVIYENKFVIIIKLLYRKLYI